MGKNLTFKKELRHYHRGDETVVACLDTPVGEDGIAHRCIAECDNNPRTIVQSDSHYLVGPIVDRLHAFEELGYEPEEIKEIIRRYRMYRLAMTSYYGGFHCTTMPKDIDEMHEFDILATENIVEKVKENILDKQFNVKKSGPNPWGSLPEIKDVKFNKPATIVFWKDGTKTVVKAQPGEPYDPEKGLAMAISKRALGNKGNYYNTIQKHLEGHEYEHEVVHVDMYIDLHRHANAIADTAQKAYGVLFDILNDKKATKADILHAVEEALGYLGETAEEDTE